MLGESFALLLHFITDSSAAAAVDHDDDVCWLYDVCAAGCLDCGAIRVYHIDTSLS